MVSSDETEAAWEYEPFEQSSIGTSYSMKYTFSISGVPSVAECTAIRDALMEALKSQGYSVEPEGWGVRAVKVPW